MGFLAPVNVPVVCLQPVGVCSLRAVQAVQLSAGCFDTEDCLAPGVKKKKHHPGSTSAEKLQHSQPVVNASAEAVPYSRVPLSVCPLKTLPFPFISQGSCAQVVFA